MASNSISSKVSVSQCSKCYGDTAYHCRTCGQNLCPPCKRIHTISLDTNDHNVMLYRERFNSFYNNEMCVTHPDQIYEKYCETCDLPVCFHCKEHGQHRLQNIRTVYENVRKQNYEVISKIRSSIVYTIHVLFVGIQAAFTSWKKEKISHQSNAMLKKSQRLKNAISNELCGELIAKHKQLLLYKLCKQKLIAQRYLINLQTHENRCQQFVCRPVQFLHFFKEVRFPQIHNELQITKQALSLLTQEIDMEYLTRRFSEIQLTGKRKRRVSDEILLTLMPFPVLKKTFEESKEGEVYHISCGLSGQIWTHGSRHIHLLDTTTSRILDNIELEGLDKNGIHTVTNDFELVYIDRGSSIKKLSRDRKTTTTFIDNSNSEWKILCVYCSPSTGDLLVGMFAYDDEIGKVARYNYSGQLKQTIPHDNANKPLYKRPCYVTENKNGDVVVSDDKLSAVVVTSRVGRHRFSYTGPPPSGSGLKPRGICTDALSHILVCDWKTNSLQMIDRDGQFLSFLLTFESPGIFAIPESVSYDVDTHLLFVGSFEDTVSVYRFIDKHFVLADVKDLRGDGTSASRNLDIFKLSQKEYEEFAALLTRATLDAEKIMSTFDLKAMKTHFEMMLLFMQFKTISEEIFSKQRKKRTKTLEKDDKRSTYLKCNEQFLESLEAAQVKALSALKAIGLATTLATAQAAAQEVNDAIEIMKKVKPELDMITEYDDHYDFYEIAKYDEDEEEEEEEEARYTILYER